MPDDRYCSKSHFAKLMNVSPSNVTFWKKRGWLVLNDAGQVDIEASKESVARNKDAGRGGRNGYDAGQTRGQPAQVLGEHRGASAIELATAADRDASRKLKELRIRRETGELVDAAAFLRGTEKAFAAVREGLSAFPARLGATMAKQLNADPRVVMHLLEDECALIAGEVGKRLEAMAESVVA
jgi:hypothetical protein